MKQEQPRNVARKIITGCASLVMLACIAQPAWAGKGGSGKEPSANANVIANAECVISDGTEVPGGNVAKNLTVTAFLEQKEKIGAAPEVGVVRFILEQHIRNRRGMRQKWKPVQEFGLPVNDTFPFSDPPVAGETVEVGKHTFSDICTYLHADANAIRGVVEVKVTNSNAKRKVGQTHTGRCISLPNPCP